MKIQPTHEKNKPAARSRKSDSGGRRSDLITVEGCGSPSRHKKEESLSAHEAMLRILKTSPLVYLTVFERTISIAIHSSSKPLKG
mmetsp:Transcript_64494/g.74061  ORF Transcript_64494/g.74061 Transcript_64494/m.74061 type:complete len:85 (-) Transcript_64494:1738-1992(-)